MSDSQEKSDDLIAELAKLMASDAQGAETGPKPSVIKLPPLNEATAQAAPVVRIPGMTAAAPAAATPTPAETPAPAPAPTVAPLSVGPAVRIPGMDRPAAVNEALPSAPAPRPQFDFGKPPVAPPVIAPEPLANWQSHEAPKTTLGQVATGPASKPDAEAERAPANVTRLEPKPAPRPAGTTSAEPEQAAAEPVGDGFTFDFGFGGGAGDEQKQPPAAANDPIADLIVAELDAAEAAPEHPNEPAAPKIPPISFNPPPMPAKPPMPAAPQPAAATPQRPAAAQAAPIRPASVAPRPAEGDRFTVAPVFGVGSKPAASGPAAPAPRGVAPRADLDPMDEIESLIGEAVRVELEAPAPRPPAQPPQAPVVPPLNTSFAPRRAQIQDAGSQAAEAAILAAAAASGAEVDRVEAPVSDDRPYKRMKVKPPRTSGISSGARQYVGIAVAGTLLLAAGFGLYWVLGMNRDDPATAPLLTADASPAKVEPVVPAITAQPSGSVVFDEINGVASVGDGETLVSRDETAGASVTEVARAVTPTVDDSTETGLANRKVRTVTVRPDGTIVSGDEAVAGTEELPVDRPNVPEIAGAEMEPSDLLTAAIAGTEAAANRPAAATAGADAISALVSETGEARATELPDPIDVAALPAAEATAPVFDGSLVAPIPMPRPSDRTVLVGSRVGQLPLVDAPAPNAPASTPLVAVAQPQQQQAAGQVSTRGGAYVQLSSQPSENEAQRSLRALQSRMAGTLNGATLEIRRVEIPGRGTWYRVALPVNSFQDATQTCAAIRANGGDCVAING